jgi:hypothetical protein
MTPEPQLTGQRKTLAQRVSEELKKSSPVGSSSFSAEGVALGGATYTKMLGKRT